MLVLTIGAGTAVALWLIYALIPTCYYRYWRHNPWETATAERSLLLSFDDGPDERYTPQLLHILDRYQVKAIFFLPGFKAEQHSDLVRQIAGSGHQIGFHGYCHRNPWAMGWIRTARDFRRGIGVLRRQGIAPFWYRPPHGMITLANLLCAHRAGMQPLLWTVLVGDWRNIGGDEVLARLWRQVARSEVICLHDSGEKTGGEPGAPSGTLAAVERFIPQALAAGYRFVTLDGAVEAKADGDLGEDDTR